MQESMNTDVLAESGCTTCPMCRHQQVTWLPFAEHICVLTPGPPHIRQSSQPPCPLTDGQMESRHALTPQGFWVRAGSESRDFRWFHPGEGCGWGRFSSRGGLSSAHSWGGCGPPALPLGKVLLSSF